MCGDSPVNQQLARGFHGQDQVPVIHWRLEELAELSIETLRVVVSAVDEQACGTDGKCGTGNRVEAAHAARERGWL